MAPSPPPEGLDVKATAEEGSLPEPPPARQPGEFLPLEAIPQEELERYYSSGSDGRVVEPSTREGELTPAQAQLEARYAFVLNAVADYYRQAAETAVRPRRDGNVAHGDHVTCRNLLTDAGREKFARARERIERRAQNCVHVGTW